MPINPVVIQSRGRRASRASAPGPGDEGETASEEADARHQERWDHRHAEANREIGRAPDKVDGSEGGDDGDPGRTVHSQSLHHQRRGAQAPGRSPPQAVNTGPPFGTEVPPTQGVWHPEATVTTPPLYSEAGRRGCSQARHSLCAGPLRPTGGAASPAAAVGPDVLRAQLRVSSRALGPSRHRPSAALHR